MAHAHTQMCIQAYTHMLKIKQIHVEPILLNQQSHRKGCASCTNTLETPRLLAEHTEQDTGELPTMTHSRKTMQPGREAKGRLLREDWVRRQPGLQRKTLAQAKTDVDNGVHSQEVDTEIRKYFSVIKRCSIWPEPTCIFHHPQAFLMACYLPQSKC